MIGTRLGPYDVLSKLGEGGMGEVYRARDSRLKRDVAIKVLPEAFARDPDRLARFEREAEVLATLNHPNIGAVYGFEESPDVNGIVLELVEGPTLADRIEAAGAKGSGLPIDEVLPIARQIVDAMIAAHEKGIIHRDLKPANIKVTADGKVKVLDFGLAKAGDMRASDSGLNVTAMPTITSPAMMTGVGVVLGTAAYMSPEQARGRAVDMRADIWAFGAVLYEMLTGRRAFPGDDVTETIANIVKTEPDWHALPAETSVAVRALLRRCLHKDPDRRLRHIADARFNLEDAETLALPATRPSAPARVVPWAVAAMAIAAAAFFAWMWQVRAPAAPSLTKAVRLEMNLPDGVELFTASSRTLAVSPDGTKIAFIGVRSGTRSIFLRSLNQFDAAPLRGSDGATACFFSPDGTAIGMISAGGFLKTISLQDGASATVSDGVNFLYGAAWLPDDTIVFVRNGRLWRVSRSGGTAKAITSLGPQETMHGWPVGVPGGKAMLFSVLSGDQWRIESLVLATGTRSPLVQGASFPLLVGGGRLLVFREGGMLSAPFDTEHLRLSGPIVRTLDSLEATTSGTPLYDASPSGTMIYSAASSMSRLVWVSRAGAEQPMNAAIRGYAAPRISPDGSRVVVQAGNLWLQDLARSTFTRLAATREEATAAFPMWSADGRKVMVRTSLGLTMHDADGSGHSEVIPGTSEFDYPAQMTADGATLVFLRSGQETSFDIMTMPLGNPGQIRALVKTSAYEGGARLSPDGKWLSYVSNESGQNEIYIRPFGGPDRRWQISSQGGTQALWNPNGREVFYRDGNKMMGVDVTAAGDDLKLSPAHLLFEQRYAFGAGITIANYDVSHDGQRFLMVKDEAGAGRLSVVLNAFADLPK
jgi:Tol biopolymer transport system component